MQWIASTIPNEVFIHVKNKSNMKAIWDTLKTKFEGHSQIKKINLNKEFIDVRCSEDENICDFFDKLAAMCERLASMGESYTNTKYAQILMGSMPAKYSNVKTSINTSTEMQQANPTTAMVIKLFIDKYNQLTRGKTTTEEALSAKTQKKKGKKSNIECFNCHKKGHTKAECWGPGGRNEGSGPKCNKKGGNGKKEGKKPEATIAKDTQDIEAWALIENCPDNLSVMAVEGGGTHPCEIFDSGALRHMSLFRKSFINFEPINTHTIIAVNKHIFHATGMGDVEIQVLNGATMSKIMLHDVLYALDMGLTVVSISHIMKASYKVEFDNNSCIVKKKLEMKIVSRIAESPNGLFKVEHALAAAIDMPMDEHIHIHMLHRRLGHIAADSIHSLIHANSITGVHLIDDSTPFSCDSCKYAKMMRKAIRKEREALPAQAFGEEIHTNIWGPSPNNSLGGRRYYVTFTDDYLHYTKVDIPRTKDQTFSSYRNFAVWAKTQHGVQIQRLRSDQGSEFTSQEFTDYLCNQGTERRLTMANMPQHNGIAESLNRQVLEHVRAMLHQSGLPKALWAEAVQHAIWLKNHTSTKALSNMTPYKRLHNHKPNLANMPKWGQTVWVHNATRLKLNGRAKEGRWIGYDANSTHAHRIYWAGSNGVSVECNVKFISPTVVIHSQPPSYQSVITPPATQQAAAPQPPTILLPAAQFFPMLQPRTTMPPITTTLPTQSTPSVLTPLPSAPQTPSNQEVEDTILPMPGGSPEAPRRSS